MAIINGTAGNDTRTGTPDADTINGLAGNDTLNGLAGNDRITGGEGNDLARMGAGNDTFVWHTGDGDDTLRGQDGFDTLVFEDTNNVFFLIERNASRVRVAETLFGLFGNQLDLDDVERIIVRPLAGEDGVFINNLAGTDLKQVVVDLAGVPGGGGDGEVDGVARNGGGGNDVMNVALVSGAVSITGPSAAVTIRNADAVDTIEINALGGNDTIDASKLPANVMQLTINGDGGNDRITGSRGNDELDGGNGNDVVAGGRGNDTVDLGPGNDLYVYSVGQGFDTVHGGDGTDTLRVTCTNADDTFSIEGTGKFVSLAEGSTFFSADDIERIRVQALGGADFISVFTQSDSILREIAIDLAASAGGTVADTSADTVAAVADANGDAMTIEWSGSNIVVSGLTKEITIAHTGKNDTLLARGLIGDDVFDASGLGAGKIRLKLEGDSGDDSLIGSGGNDTAVGGDGNDLASLGAGNDLFQGGAGNDRAFLGAGNDRFQGGVGDDRVSGGDGNDRVSGDAGNDRALLGAGNDVFVWREGDGGDIIEGQGGFDTFDFRGNADILLLANAGRVQFSDSGGPTSLLDDVERIRVHASDGFDVIHVGKLVGTNLKQLDILDFDGSPLGGGTDELDLDPLFDALGVAAAARAGRVSIVDKGATVDVFVNADGNASNGFELAVATLHTPNTITVGLGQDVVVGT